MTTVNGTDLSNVYAGDRHEYACTPSDARHGDPHRDKEFIEDVAAMMDLTTRAASPELVRRVVLEHAAKYPELRGWTARTGVDGYPGRVCLELPTPPRQFGDVRPKGTRHFGDVRRDTLEHLRADASLLVAKAASATAAARAKVCPECTRWGGPPVSGAACDTCGGRQPDLSTLASTRESLGLAPERERLAPEPPPAPIGYTFTPTTKNDQIWVDTTKPTGSWRGSYYFASADKYEHACNTDPVRWAGHEEARQHAARLLGETAPPLRGREHPTVIGGGGGGGTGTIHVTSRRAITPDPETLPAGWVWGETDGPGVVRAYRDSPLGGFCRIDAGVRSELAATPEVWAAVEARARRLGLIGDAPPPPPPPPGRD